MGFNTEFTVYGQGLCCASVCTSLSPEDAAQRLNTTHPTGIDSKWELSEDEYFADKVNKNGCQCPDYPENKHYLFVC